MNLRESLEPVSWLKLELYHLGELPADEMAEVEHALETDPATRECLRKIEEPITLRPLPDLSVNLQPRPEEPGRSAAQVVTWLKRWPVGAVALAATVLLYLATSSTDSELRLPPARVRIKGGDVALELVRERQGGITRNPKAYESGDRFKIQLTCPPAMSKRFVAMVLQGGDVFFPLSPFDPLQCGNNLAWPGAFALTGNATARICVSWDPPQGLPSAASDERITRALKSAVCRELEARP